MNIPLVLAHAKNAKAIAYLKVKSDKVDSNTLAQLLRMDYIPSAHKISNEKRFLRDALRAVQYYPVIRKFNNSLLRKKNKQIAKTIIAKEIAKIVYYVLKYKENFNNKFKGKELEHKKSLQWPRVISPYA